MKNCFIDFSIIEPSATLSLSRLFYFLKKKNINGPFQRLSYFFQQIIVNTCLYDITIALNPSQSEGFS